MGAREFDGFGRAVHAHHAFRRAGQFGRPVARAATRVQHALAARQAGGEGVARHVLVEQVDVDLARDSRARQ